MHYDTFYPISHYDSLMLIKSEQFLLFLEEYLLFLSIGKIDRSNFTTMLFFQFLVSSTYQIHDTYIFLDHMPRW